MSRKARKGALESDRKQPAQPKEAGPQPEDDGIRVVLKPVLGVSPGTYLTVLYAVALVVLSYLFLFLPGIRKNGTYFSIKTYPASATVRVDGTYAGTTPCEVFVARGKHRIEIHRSFHKDSVFEEYVNGRIFGTLILPVRRSKTISLEVESLDQHFQAAFLDFAENQHIPTIISDAMLSIGTVLKKTHSKADYEKAYLFLYNCMQYITSETQLRSIIGASTLASSGGSILSVTSLVELIQKSIQVKENNPNLPAWILSCLEKENAQRLLSSAWIKDYSKTYQETIARFYQEIPPLGNAGPAITRSVTTGIRFLDIPSGTLIMGKDDRLETLGAFFDPLLPHPIAVSSFRISETEITNRQYKAFLEESPEWRKSNTAALLKNGFVAEGYLSSWTEESFSDGSDDLPVVNVSRFAALAYCGWLTGKLSHSAPGISARLPMEAEWEWAARGGLRGMPYPLGEKAGKSVFFRKGITGPEKAGASEANGYGLRDMAGNVWEWCADDCAPASYLFSSAAPHGPDAVVRGGAWNNEKESVKVFTRASQPESWCTPYLGFRVVLSRS